MRAVANTGTGLSLPAAGLPVRSTIEGIAWPSFPDPAGEAMLAMLWQLERSEGFAPARLRALQMVQARALLRHAVAHVPFYRDLWQGMGVQRLGFDPGVDALTPKRFAALPVVTREMIRDAGEKAFSTTVPQAHGGVQAALTSGTSGTPLQFRTTGLTRFMWRAFTLRDHLWHRRDLTGKLAAIRAMPSSRVEEENWGLATAGLCVTGPAVGLHIDHDVAEQAAWLLEQDPNSLVTHPSNLHALAGWFRDRGLKLPNLRDIRAVSERVSPAQRAACREAFGLPLVDSYSMLELGYVALQCPAGDRYHVQEESVLVELLDDRDQPVPQGTMGRVVVTSLLNFAMPFVRYDTGDYATAGAPCPCGRGLAVLDRIDGRARNLMTRADGTLRRPDCDLIELNIVPGILQYQFVQTAVDRVELRVVASRRLDADDGARIEAVVRERLGDDFDLVLSRMDQLPRPASGKFEDFVNLTRI